MTLLIVAVLLALVAIFGLVGSFVTNDEDLKVGGKGLFAVCGILAIIALGFSSYNRVDEGHVGIPVTFGQAGASVEPGAHWLAPWTSVVEMDTRLQETTFSGDTVIRARAVGGGEVLIDTTVQWKLDPSAAPDVYRQVGDMDTLRARVVNPAIRECVRNAPFELNLTPEEAATSGRVAIAEFSYDCISEDVSTNGVQLRSNLEGEGDGVKIRNVDPGEAVRAAIEAKTVAEQQLQQRAVDLEAAEVQAQIDAVNASAINDAERIIACGSEEIANPDYDSEGNGDEPRTLIVPSDECGEQFSPEYLQWLWITTFGAPENGDQIIVCETGTCDGLILNASPQAATEGG